MSPRVVTLNRERANVALQSLKCREQLAQNSVLFLGLLPAEIKDALKSKLKSFHVVSRWWMEGQVAMAAESSANPFRLCSSGAALAASCFKNCSIPARWRIAASSRGFDPET
jgi:hypothetical protein